MNTQLSCRSIARWHFSSSQQITRTKQISSARLRVLCASAFIERHRIRMECISLPPLNPGPMNITVIATGWSPDSRTVAIKAPGSTEDFQLKKGKVLRIRFMDDRGNAVPNVSVSIRGWQGKKSLYNHRHPNVLNTKIPVKSDSMGIFEWRWAPADEIPESPLTYHNRPEKGRPRVQRFAAYPLPPSG